MEEYPLAGTCWGYGDNEMSKGTGKRSGSQRRSEIQDQAVPVGPAGKQSQALGRGNGGVGFRSFQYSRYLGQFMQDSSGPGQVAQLVGALSRYAFWSGHK